MEEKTRWVVIAMVILAVIAGYLIAYNPEPTHTQTITTVDKVSVRTTIDMTNESMNINQAVDMIINARQQLKRLE